MIEMFQKKQKSFKNIHYLLEENNFVLINPSSHTSTLYKHFFSGEKLFLQIRALQSKEF